MQKKVPLWGTTSHYTENSVHTEKYGEFHVVVRSISNACPSPFETLQRGFSWNADLSDVSPNFRYDAYWSVNGESAFVGWVSAHHATTSLIKLKNIVTDQIDEAQFHDCCQKFLIDLAHG